MATVTVELDGTSRSVPITVTSSAPTVPTGYSLIENQTFTTNPKLHTGSAKIAYRNCSFPNGLNIEDTANHIWLDQCTLGGLWIFGPVQYVELHRSSWGGVSGQDGSQIWAKAVTGGGYTAPPTHILMEDCLIHDVTRTSSTQHPDGLQVGGVSDLTLRRCEFKNIDVQPMFLNAWTANIDGVLIDSCKIWQPTPTGFYSIIVGAGSGGYIGKNVQMNNNHVGAPINYGVNGTSRADDPTRNNHDVGTVLDPALITR